MSEQVIFTCMIVMYIKYFMHLFISSLAFIIPNWNDIELEYPSVKDNVQYL